MSINIVLKGRIPSKKNSKSIVKTKTGKTFLISSRSYANWHREQSLTMFKKFDRPIKNLESIIMDFYFPDDRKTDLTNKAESVMDLLVDNSIIRDDSWKEVSKLCLNGIKIDKANPRVEIVINTRENE
jgi:hypothetical protein